MNSADTYLANLLDEYEKLETTQREELKELPSGQLSVRQENGYLYYMHYLPAEKEGKRMRRGITRDKQMIRDLARKKYLQQSLQLLEKNIPMLEMLLKTHKAPTPTNIIASLPDSLKRLPPETFLPEIKEQNEWENKNFRQSTYKPEEKTHITARGLKVRSKSEVIVAEKLNAYHIPFHYEQMLYFEDQAFSPDFTILRGDGLVYWEHCGKVNDEDYMAHHNWKLGMYGKAGIVPWKNLIVTYDDENGGLDSRIIEAEIVNKLLV